MKTILLFIFSERYALGIGLALLVLVRIAYMVFRYYDRQSKLSRIHYEAVQSRLKNKNLDAVRVRQTDIIENLDRQARMIYSQAENLEKEGKFVDAASLFESVNFQRRAVDILEHNGFIEKACEVLVRLNSPHRAAIICERNRMDELAARYFSAANQMDKAGNALLRLATTDYHFYEKAAVYFEKSGHTSGMLKCWGPLLETERILQLCLDTAHLEFLIHYMRDPVNARKILPVLTFDQLQEMFNEISFSPEMIQTVINWVYYVPDQRLYRLSLRFCGRDVFMCRLYWQMATEELSKTLFTQLLAIIKEIEPENLENHISYFNTSGQLDRAAILSEQMGNWLGASRILLRMGNILQCYYVLNHHQQHELARKMEIILKDQSKGPWTIDQIEKAKFYIESHSAIPLDISKAPSAA